MRLGIGLPNRALRPGEAREILATGCRDVLVYGAGDWALAQVRDLRALDPAVRIHYRGEARGSLSLPAIEGFLCRERISRLDPVSVRWRNEPNVESPGETPQNWKDFVRDFVRVLKALRPDVLVAVPAVAPVGDWEPWLEASVEGAKKGEADILDVHAYGFPEEVAPIVKKARSLWSGTLYVTETNQGAGRAVDMDRYVQALPEVLRLFREARAEAVFWFIWDWENPDLDLQVPVSLRALPRVRETWSHLTRESARESAMNWQPVDKRAVLPKTGDYPLRDLSRVWGITLHYTAGPPEQTAEEVARYQISPAAASQTGVGVPFPALAYHLFVEGDGTVVLAHDLDRRVWHSAGRDPVTGEKRNDTHVGLCYAGNVAPNDHQMEGLARAIVWCETVLGRRLLVEGHGDVYPTLCPGPRWPAWKSPLLGLVDRFRQEDPMDDLTKQKLLDHLGVIWGYAQVVWQAGDALRSAVLLEAAQAIRERIVALKRDLGLSSP